MTRHPCISPLAFRPAPAAPFHGEGPRFASPAPRDLAREAAALLSELERQWRVLSAAEEVAYRENFDNPAQEAAVEIMCKAMEEMLAAIAALPAERATLFVKLLALGWLSLSEQPWPRPVPPPHDVESRLVLEIEAIMMGGAA